jgi:quercetin dioxygenase-like cupin family protein
MLNQKLPDPLESAGNAYKFVSENNSVRLLKVTLKPGEKAAMHHHPDHVIYVLSGGKAKLTDFQGKIDKLDLKTGDSMSLPAQSHETENIGDTTLDILVIELKK